MSVDVIFVGWVTFGIELGFIWIKVVFVGDAFIEVFAIGVYEWEN